MNTPNPFEHIELASDAMLAKKIAEIARRHVGEDQVVLLVASRRLAAPKQCASEFCSDCFE